MSFALPRLPTPENYTAGLMSATFTPALPPL
jgi:hypothetical protein